MKPHILFTLSLSLLLTLPLTKVAGVTPENNLSQDTTKVDSKNKLVVVWTSGDREVALKMVFMYTYNANKYKWWDDITLMVWGPSAKLLTEDEELQNYVKSMINEGIEVLACKGCADLYEISDQLEQIGIIVRYTGADLTNFIKERNVITF
ncbi:MAG: DsrE family protein [Bacteroidales bacterium]|nr:DsrE family protein [Bacteroidales bacterium]